MRWWGLTVGLLAAAAAPVLAQGVPLADKFTPEVMFPPGSSPPPPAPKVVIPPPVLPGQPDPPDGGLLPPPPPPKIWSGSADLGLNGATGNSDLFNFRSSWNVRRKTARNTLTSDFLYTYSKQDGSLNTHQALFNARDEELFPGTRWSLFAASQVEYDELRSYRFRIGTYTGAAYTVLDDKYLSLKTRAGAGAVRELGTGGPRDRWVAELVLGYDFRWKLNDRSSFISILDYYPRPLDPSEFRVRARAAFEYVIDPAHGLILRLGVQDRYDSDPGNAKRNDLTYFTTLGFKF